jgi:hypothetical protein
MRSQGYDTYAQVDKKEMVNLYVANPKIKYQRTCYWQQNFTTNLSTPVALSRSHASRRNALADAEDLSRSAGEDEAITLLRRSLRQAARVVEAEINREDQNPE